MIAVFTALYPEAEPLLLELRRRGIQMKRLPSGSLTAWRSKDDRYMLAVTGSGEIAAAIATAQLLTQFPADFAVNFGTAAGSDPAASCFRICKITEETTGRDFYPGMVWAAPFAERALITVPHPAAAPAGTVSPSLPCLTDMEGAGFFQAAARFLSTDKIVLLKAVSDAGETAALTPDRLRAICAAVAAGVTDCLTGLSEAVDAYRAEEETIEEPALMAKAEADLNGSEAMRLRLHRILCWQALSGEDLRKLVRKLYEDGSLPAGSKKKGKEVLEQLERDIL